MTDFRHRIYFIRHGETDWNREGRLQGQRDIPLNDLGRAQAEEAGRRLATLVAPHPLPWHVSPLLRTQETAKRARLSVEMADEGYLLEDRLKELSFGRWEGLTWREVKQSDPAGAARREAYKWGMVPPDGESYALLIARLQPWLDTVTQDCVVVAHGGVARGLLHLVGKLDPLVAAESDIWQGRLLVLEHGQHRWV
jgi:probable phosphoglycerate mutase